MATLKDVLGPLDWNGNVQFFLSNGTVVAQVDALAVLIANWAKQIETVEGNNLAVAFVRDMQSSMFFSIAEIALGLYRPAAGSMRGMFESALYYTFFRTHPMELGTLARDPLFYMEKKELIEFHQQHSAGFQEAQHALGLLSGVQNWYPKVSKLVHAQIPGQWGGHTSMAGITHNPLVLDEAVKTFAQGADLVHRLFLSTVARELWRDFSPPSKGVILHGMPGPLRAQLGLDSA